jgi:hypothetical protein
MSFIGRFGNSCGIPFDKNKFCDKHIQWNIFRPYLYDRPSQPWAEFSITNDYSDKKEEDDKKDDKKEEDDIEEKKDKKVKGGKSRRLLKRKNKTKKMK